MHVYTNRKLLKILGEAKMFYFLLVLYFVFLNVGCHDVPYYLKVSKTQGDKRFLEIKLRALHTPCEAERLTRGHVIAGPLFLRIPFSVHDTQAYT